MKVVVVGGAGNVVRLFATHLGAGGDGVERVDVRRRGAGFFASRSETS